MIVGLVVRHCHDIGASRLILAKTYDTWHRLFDQTGSLYCHGVLVLKLFTPLDIHPTGLIIGRDRPFDKDKNWNLYFLSVRASIML